MAGTAEQAIGLAKPVIQIEGKGPQFINLLQKLKEDYLEICFCATNYLNKKIK